VPSNRDAGSASIDHLGLCAGAIVAAIISVGLYSRVMAKRMSGHSFHRHLRRYNRIMKVARFAIPVWFGVMVYVLDFPLWVMGLIKPLQGWPVESPGFL